MQVCHVLGPLSKILESQKQPLAYYALEMPLEVPALVQIGRGTAPNRELHGGGPDRRALERPKT